MKKILSVVIILSFNLSYSISKDSLTSVKIEYLAQEIKLVRAENKNLKQELEINNASNKSVCEVIDKIDALYNNNFTTFMIFWGIIASIVIVGVPYYITRMQKKIIEIKKDEIFRFSSSEINKLETKLNSDLTEKYVELSNLINESSAKNREEVKNESVKIQCRSLYIASKINEIDQNFNQVFNNLELAITRSSNIGDNQNTQFYLKKFLEKYEKFTSEGVVLNADRIKNLVDKFKSLEDNEDIDQEILSKLIEKFAN